MSTVEIVEDSFEVVEVIEEGPAGPQGISIPTEVVNDFPTEPTVGTLYIKV